MIGLLATGILTTAQGPPARRELQLTLVDREGRRTALGSVPGSTFAPRVSPDGRAVTFDTNDDGSIWVATLSDIASRRRLTTEGRNRGPMWSGDGKRILYVTDHEGAETLFWRLSDGSGTAELLTKPARAPESWPPGQRLFSFITFKQGGDYDIWTYSLDSRRPVVSVAVPGSPQHSSQFSPDGRWMAYVSGETGRLEVYVRRTTVEGAAIQVTTSGGGHPVWSPDQKELFFDNSGRMFVVSINPASPAFLTGQPRELPITGFLQGPLRRQFDLMPDGKHFLMLFPQ
jgi:serine/threonine-protein kinase